MSKVLIVDDTGTIQTEDPEHQARLVNLDRHPGLQLRRLQGHHGSIALWINESSSRVPLTDCYDTKTGKQEGFQARSVVGGVFLKALADKQLTDKWRAMAIGRK